MGRRGERHRLTPPHRPHNSLYVISDRGELATRYDKRFLSHTEITGWHTPGRSRCVFEVGGWRFGCVLCIEVHFPELFREYAEHDVDCVLLSAYADDAMFGIQARGYAASHSYWVSVSVPGQLSRGIGSRLIAPNGEIQAAAPPSISGLAVELFDVGDPRWEVPLHRARPWRAEARDGESIGVGTSGIPGASGRRGSGPDAGAGVRGRLSRHGSVDHATGAPHCAVNRPDAAARSRSAMSNPSSP